MKHIITLLALCQLLIIKTQAQTSPINAAQFGTMEARSLGPGTTSGRITAIEGVNQNTNIIYVGTAGGGLWKSTNAGASYKPMFNKYCQSIGAIAINQQDGKTIYLGTGESNMRNSVSIGNGLYKSTDEGSNWKKIGLDSTEHISKIIIDPKNQNTIYVAVPGALWSNSTHRGLYKSTDAGQTWNKILYTDDKTGCADIAIDPTNPQIIYASMWQFRRQAFSFNSGGPGSALYKSTNGGATWQELTQGMPPKPFGRIALALAPSNPKKLLAIIEAKETGLYISENSGQSWKSQSAPMNVVARPFYFSTLAFDPKDEKRVYRPAFQFSYSNDGGYSFADASYDGGWVHSDMHAIWINPQNTNVMYIGTDGGVYTSLDKGATWQFCHGLPVGQFYHIAIDNQTPYNIYGGLQDNGSWYAPSATPGGIGNANWQSLYGGDGFWTQPDLLDANIVYAEYQGGNMARINKSNMKSEAIQPKQIKGNDDLRWNWNTPIVIGSKNPKNLYTASQYLYKSTDQGRNWTQISQDLTTNNKAKQKQEESGGLSADNTSAENHCTIFTIAESPLDENLIAVGTDDGNLQISTNAGKSWQNYSPAIAKCGIASQAWVSSIYLSTFDKNTLFATFDNHTYGDHQTYLAKSTNLGQTWTRITNDNFTGFAHKIIQDLENQNLLFLGTEMGLFCSLDAGSTWFRMKNEMAEYALVRDLKIHPKTHDLIIGTHGRGAYILDDIRPIRNITPQIMEKDVVIFETPNLSLNTYQFGGGGPQTSGGWYAGNPSTTAPITYFLKDKINTGKVEIQIFDNNQKLIQKIPASKRKGINMVYWNLRETPPKTASGGTKADGAGFTAPKILPGTYTAKLIIADKEYPTTLHVTHDDANKDLSIADEKLIYQKATDLKKLYENLNQIIDTVSTMQQTLQADSTYAISKAGKAFIQEIDTYKSELLATKQKSIFADEKKFREKISELYSEFCSLEAKPSNLQLLAIDNLQNEFITKKNAFLALQKKHQSIAKKRIKA